METENAERKECLKSWAHVVRTLFQSVVEDSDMMLRPTMLPFDGAVPGTIITLVRRETNGATACLEEIFSSCDFETFGELVRAYQRHVNTHVVTGDRFSLFAYNKANLKDKASRSYVAA